LATLVSFGQLKRPEFISYLEKSSIKQSERQNKALLKATFSKTTKVYYFIKLANLPDAQEKGVLTMKLPNIEKELTFEATKVEAKSKTEYSWFGNLKEGNDSAVLIANKDGFTGTIEVEEKHFMIQLQSGKYILNLSNGIESKSRGLIIAQ
jgi:hypothetical protein